MDDETPPEQLNLQLSSSLMGTHSGAALVDEHGVFNQAWPDLVAGDHVITVEATDEEGASGSATLNVSVCDNIWYSDTDGDGFGISEDGVIACERPAGNADTDADCDDDDPDVNPGVGENCFDGIDNDCDGTADRCDLADADARLHGENASDHAGYAVSGAGDTDGDGLKDVLVGVPGEDSAGERGGAVYLIHGPATNVEVLSDAGAKFTGTCPGHSIGRAVSTGGDTNGDGFDDILVGAPGYSSCSSAVYLLLGPVSGNGDLPRATLVPDSGSDEVGESVSGGGDINGDGLGDVVVGARLDDSAGRDAGAVYVVTGPVSGDSSLADAIARFMGEVEDDHAGWSVALAGDINRDGLDDVIVGAPYASSSESCAGVAYVLLAPVSGVQSLSTAQARLIGEYSGGFAGASVSGAGDLDSDGYDDVAVGAWSDGTQQRGAGAVHLWFGPTTGAHPMSNADATLIGESVDSHAGVSVSHAGDIDGDGNSDIVVGAPGLWGGGWPNTGGAYLVQGPFSGLRSLTSARFVGESMDDSAGTSVSGAGDVNGDGRDDVLVGAPFADDTSIDVGATYLVLGR